MGSSRRGVVLVCTGVSTCAATRCVGGSCVASRDDAMCDAAEYCDPDAGCTPLGGGGGNCLDIAPADTVLWLDFADPLDDGAEDVSGNGLDAECGASCPVEVTGVRGAAAQFDGSNGSHLRVPYDPLLDFSSGFTVSVFVSPDSVSDAVGCVSMALGSGGDNSFLVGNVGGGELVFWSDRTGGRHDLRGPDLPTGTWSHIVGSYDATTNQKALYLDGAEVDSASIVGVDFDGHDLFISADEDSGGPNDPLTGAIDEVQIFDRALTPAEVSQLFECGIP